MKDLAVVLVTCDKYSWLWDAWYYYFRKHWHVDCPVYFCNEIKPVDYDGITHVPCGYVSPNANGWTKQVRECVEQIPEQHLFVILEDLLFEKDISETFKKLYVAFKLLGADAMRIRSKATRAKMTFTSICIDGVGIKCLTDNSKYLITFSANLWDRTYLMECLSRDQSPWTAELSSRMKGMGWRVYDYVMPNWYVNALVLGRMTTGGTRKINEYENRG